MIGAPDSAIGMVLAFSRQPLDEPVHEIATYAFTGLMVVACAAMVTWSLRVAHRESTWLPIACLLGGLLAFGFEPVLDSVAHILYPLGSPLTVVTIFDATIPAFVVLAYIFWVGAGAFMLMRWLETGPSGARIVRTFLVFCLVEPLFEYPAVLSKALLYYGDQPLKVFGYPWYWSFGNTGAVFIAAYVLLIARPHLRGAGGFAVAALIPALSYCGVSAMGSWPVWIAINSEAPIAVIWLAGAVAIMLHVSLVRLMAWCVDHRLAFVSDVLVGHARRSIWRLVWESALCIKPGGCMSRFRSSPASSGTSRSC